MATVPAFGLGRLLTSIVVTPQTVAMATGVLTPTTPVATLTGYLTSYDYTMTNETEEISAVTARQQNYMIISSGTVLTLEGMILNGNDAASAVNTIRAIVLAVDYAVVVITQFTQVWTFTGVLNSYNEGVRDKGKIPWRLEMQMASIGTNPTSA